MQLGLVADPVIQAIARQEFEKVEAAGTLVAAAPNPESILHHPGGAGWSWGWCGCQKGPLSDQIQILLSSVHGWY